MLSKPSFGVPVVSMHLSDKEVEEVLERMERTRHRAMHLPSNGPGRVPFRRSGVTLTLEHPGATTSVLKVWTRNISPTCMAVVLGSFLHPGTECAIELPRHDGQRIETWGVVQSCRLIRGIIHETDIAFAELLDLEQFVNVAMLRPEPASGLPPRSMIETRPDLAEQVRMLLLEIADLIEQPRLSRAITVCKRLREHAETLGWSRLSLASQCALQSLQATGSVAKSEAALLKLRSVRLGE